MHVLTVQLSFGIASNLDSRLKERSYVVFSEKRSMKSNKMAKEDSAKPSLLTIPLPCVL